MYNDCIDMEMEPSAAAAALQVGLYYGAPRLVSLCEVIMCSTLTDDSVSPAGEPYTRIPVDGSKPLLSSLHSLHHTLQLDFNANASRLWA